MLLAKMKANIGAKVKNPADIQREHVEKRRAVVVLQEQRALERRCYNPFALSKIKKRDASLEHLMMIRNAPKLHLSQLCGLLRAAVLDRKRTATFFMWTSTRWTRPCETILLT